MNAIVYCPQCGFHETLNPPYDGTNLDAERHCTDCSAVMITQCSNKECPQRTIESLNQKYCPCGTELSNIEIAKKRDGDSHFATKRPF